VCFEKNQVIERAVNCTYDIMRQRMINLTKFSLMALILHPMVKFVQGLEKISLQKFLVIFGREKLAKNS